MTIAAGFICADGIVVCADTQFSNDVIKVSQTKVSVSESKKCLIAAAGVDVLIDKAVNRILETVRQEMTLGEVEIAISDVLHELYVDYIDPTENPAFDVSILVAVNAADGAALFKHARWAVAPEKRYACIGTGAGLGTFIAERLFVGQTLPCISASIVAAHVLQVAKKYDTWCGKESEIFVLPTHGWAYEQSQGNIKRLEQYFDIVDVVLRPLLLAIPDPGLDNNNIEDLIQRFCEGVRTTRPFPFDITVQLTEGLSATGHVGTMGAKLSPPSVSQDPVEPKDPKAPTDEK